MRTLIISDLHLGTRDRADVLRRPAPRRQLIGALEDIDRLVLLGDVVELMEGRARRAMAIAEPVLREIGARLGGEREVIVVPGNHDAPLIRPWVRENLDRIGLDTEIEPDATRYLARLTSWLAPARVEVRYPGVWLSPAVWATHGHYMNRHLLPASAYGIRRRGMDESPAGSASPGDYERRRPQSEWASVMPGEAAKLLLKGASAPVRKLLLRPQLSPVIATLLGGQLREAGLPALGEVLWRLGVGAEWVVFGHVHRLGPLSSEEAEWWRAFDGGPALVGCGSWMYEPMLVDQATPPNPYWAGGAVLLEDDGPPEPIGLLDGLEREALR